MTRPADPFASPPSKKVPKVKRDTPSEAAEKAYVRRRDGGCVAGLVLLRATTLPEFTSTGCVGPLEVDHVRASGGLGMKSLTDRTNMVLLCRWHHKLKTEYGRTWRPLLLAYLERVER